MQLIPIKSLAILSAAIASAAADYQVVGSFIFSRHGDREIKPTNILTPLGAQQLFSAGQFFRERYLESSDNNALKNMSDYYVYGELVAENPSSSTVVHLSQVAFLQGFYPPVGDTSAEGSVDVSVQEVPGAVLANKSYAESPLDGYQYVFIGTRYRYTEDHIWIKGDMDCPALTTAQNGYTATSQFAEHNESTYEFYQSLSDILPSDVFSKSELNFGNAYEIFDYVNYQVIHQSGASEKYSSELLEQLRVLADLYSFEINFDSSDPTSNRSIGGKTFAASVVDRLNTTRVEGKPYMTHFAGSYDTMLQYFGLAGLSSANANFTGLPDYGSSLVWELLEDTQSPGSHYVRFSFRNGTAADEPLTAVPLFGRDDVVISWEDFVSDTAKFAIPTVADWCGACDSWNTVAFCAAYSPAYLAATELQDRGVDIEALASGKLGSQGGLSLAAAGGIGAGVTLGVCALFAAVAYLLFRRSAKAQQTQHLAEKQMTQDEA